MGIAGELENVLSSDELRSLAWRKKQPKVFKSIPKQRDELAAAESDGWRIVRDNKYTYRLARPKKKSVLLEDRVWSLLYRLGF